MPSATIRHVTNRCPRGHEMKAIHLKEGEKGKVTCKCGAVIESSVTRDEKGHLVIRREIVKPSVVPS